MSDEEFEAEMNRRMDELGIEEWPTILISPKDKAVADKAAKLIIRDYGEVIKKLEEE